MIKKEGLTKFLLSYYNSTEPEIKLTIEDVEYYVDIISKKGIAIFNLHFMPVHVLMNDDQDDVENYGGYDNLYFLLNEYICQDMFYYVNLKYLWDNTICKDSKTYKAGVNEKGQMVLFNNKEEVLV